MVSEERQKKQTLLALLVFEERSKMEHLHCGVFGKWGQTLYVNNQCQNSFDQSRVLVCSHDVGACD